MSTSFRNVFRRGDVSRIEIPIVQRDYAQGRKDGGVPRIRKAFLEVLHGALTGSEAVGLDFVYGEVEDGRMIPLDGQQRLTTLFLLHWYLAARCCVSGDECDFLGKFTYKTRYSARDFCAHLITQRPSFPLAGKLSTWLGDQHWYAGAWRHDPTIQSMRVVLDDIHDLFCNADGAVCHAAWQRLVSDDEPAITFESLSLADMGLTDELYIKMNSRGKPLTDFEHFKADFEQTLREVSEAHHDRFDGKESPYQEFIRKVDQDWSDLLWPLRGSDDIIDDEFLRLFRFLTDIVIHRYGLPVEPDAFDRDIDLWAKGIYGKANGQDPLATQRYLFDALDSLFAVFGPLKRADTIADWFRGIFTEKGYRPGAVAIFDKQVDLLGACCEKYGIMAGKNRLFSLSRTLLLFAVLEYLMADPKPEDFAQRLRTVRNLVFASNDEIRPGSFSALLVETSQIVSKGDLSEVQTYNKRQIDEEGRKADFLARHPDHPGLREILHRLEDHDLLRGCIAVFDLGADAATFARRAALFHEVFPEDGKPSFREIGAALLACGNYSRQVSEGRYQFGSPELPSVWRELLTNSASTDFARTRGALLSMLDALACTAGASISVRLQAIADAYLAVQEKAGAFDWRYYLVKYPVMRAGYSGLYISSSGVMGFDLCMMERWQLNSYYRDPYLLAVIEQSGARFGQDVAPLKHYGWDGYQQQGRWIELARTGENLMSCRNEGFLLQGPSQAGELAAFMAIIQKHGADADGLLKVPQVLVDGVIHDQEDRILLGARLLQAFVAGPSLLSAG